MGRFSYSLFFSYMVEVDAETLTSHMEDDDYGVLDDEGVEAYYGPRHAEGVGLPLRVVVSRVDRENVAKREIRNAIMPQLNWEIARERRLIPQLFGAGMKIKIHVEDYYSDAGKYLVNVEVGFCSD